MDGLYDVAKCGRFQTRGVGNPATIPPEWRDAKRALKRRGHGRRRLIGRPSELLPYVVTYLIGGQVSAGRIRVHHVERRSPAAACPRDRDGTLIVKWDLDNQKAMKSAATRRILDLISELEAEGLL